MKDRYYYEYEEAGGYCYPGTYTLVNKLNITEYSELHNAEREISALSLAALLDNPVNGALDFKHLKNIHFEIFKDLYDWAGKVRTVNIVKGNRFCDVGYIDVYAEKLFSQLKEEGYLTLTPSSTIPSRLAYYLGEINTLHPFREGNGRVQRVFIEYLAKAAGYSVDFSLVTPNEMIEASALSFNRDYQKMTAIMQRILAPIKLEEQKIFIQKMTRNRGPVYLAWHTNHRR